MTETRAIVDRLAEDDLTGALTLATQAVQRAPQSPDLRVLLIDLLVLAQEWERADRQAGLAATLSPADAVGYAMLRGEIRGMHARAAWHESGAVPSFPGGPTARDEAAMRLALAVRGGDAGDIAGAVASLETAGDTTALRWNDAAPQDVRDLDDLLPHALEVITTGGAYLWVDFSRIAALRFDRPSRPRDLAFRPAELDLRNGSTAQVLVAALYHAPPGSADALRLGRETDWIEGPGGIVSGRGQRCFLVGDDICPVAEARTIAQAMAEEAVDG